jgi:hypothetical protein
MEKSVRFVEITVTMGEIAYFIHEDTGGSGLLRQLELADARPIRGVENLQPDFPRGDGR